METADRPIRLNTTLSKDEFERLKTELEIDGFPVALLGWSGGNRTCGSGKGCTFAEIRPHRVPGYCHVTVINDGIAEGITRGVNRTYVDEVMRMLECQPEDLIWLAHPCTPTDENPWLWPPPTQRKKSSPGDVYCVQGEEGGPVKIGWAESPEARLQTLQCGSPVPLRLIAVVRGGGRSLESQLHDRFRAARLYGEWFCPTESLWEWIRSNAEEVSTTAEH